MPNPIKEAILNRGWAGPTLSRSDTAEHLNALIEEHTRLNRYYTAAIETYDDDRVVDVLERLQKTARTDIAKLAETVLSCGATPYYGTELEAADFEVDENPIALLDRLTDLETDLNQALDHEIDEVEHQMRTRGVLEAVRSNSTDRLEALESLTRRAEKDVV